MLASSSLSSSLHYFHSPPSPTFQNLKSSSTNDLLLIHKFNTPFELKQLHARLIKTNTPLSVLPLTKVASVCALSPSFSYARHIFSHLLFQTQQTSIWNSCLRHFAESDFPFNALLLFYQMRLFDVLPDAFTCSFVLKACLKLSDVVNGKTIHGFVHKLGFASNLFLQNMILNLYGLCGEMGDAMLLFEKMPQRDVVTWNIMITQLVKKGDIESAYGFFLRMPERNVRSWTSMISGFVQCGKPQEAVDLFMKLEDEAVRPNEVTVVSVLAACADLGELDLGRSVHEYSKKSGFRRNVHVCNTLIDMYVKCGCLENARRVFDEMADPTVVSWSAMIAGLAMHGEAEEALWLFSEMIKLGVKPNGVTFIGLLHACSHMGLIDEGRRFFASMTTDYGITPQIEHYGCMVDLFSRAGLLQEAHQFIMSMPIKPNGVVWGLSLVGAKFTKTLIWLKKQQNTFLNWILLMMDQTHPQAEDISQMWDKLLVEMKRRGYAPNTSVVLLDMEEKEKQKFLHRHSEKLAVAFGLMTTPVGTPIRIMKNLRVCEDCHAALKLISDIANREIIVRDRNRFHCFKGGQCSCRDFW
ncbi:unnamed protein product [Dovyalis caffra]|uniref:DYW domain-containing protein n=1 Tax=Dovyalis caffra TaxID=77055 RepID=A0AAV1QSL4_9ROSI|nr:unnamed protein product [Dovyalis caffra]